MNTYTKTKKTETYPSPLEDETIGRLSCGEVMKTSSLDLFIFINKLSNHKTQKRNSLPASPSSTTNHAFKFDNLKNSPKPHATYSINSSKNTSDLTVNNQRETIISSKEINSMEPNPEKENQESEVKFRITSMQSNVTMNLKEKKTKFIE